MRMNRVDNEGVGLALRLGVRGKKGCTRKV